MRRTFCTKADRQFEVLSEQKGAWDGLVVAHASERWLGSFLRMLSNEKGQALEGSLELVSLSLFLFLLPPVSHQVSSKPPGAGPSFLMA